MRKVELASITFDAGTQVRAALDQDHVATLADAMLTGATVPPIVLFHDGSHHYIGDGFHRFMAAQRLKWREIDADVKAGGQQDALWFALGANRNQTALPMKPADKRHAILMALQMWPERSQTQLAEQIGCTQGLVSQVISANNLQPDRPDRVTGKDGKSYPATRSASTEQPKMDRSKAAVAQRQQSIRDMAGRGYTSRQIAGALGMTREGIAAITKREGIAVHADRVIGRSQRHDSARIVEHMVMDAANLTADVDLIDFSALDAAQIPEWLKSLGTSREKLGLFIRRLMKEQQKNNGEAA